MRLDLAAPNLWVVFFFTSTMLVNRHSDFQAPGLLTGVDVMGDIVLSSVNPSGVETIEASRISLNCCWSSHSSACLYIFLCFQDICVHIYNCCLRICQYQWSVRDILVAVIVT